MILLRGKWRWIFICMAILFYCLSPYHAAAVTTDISKGPVKIEADSIAYEKEKDTYHAKGNVLIEFSGGILMAESVVLNRITNEALAEGYVLLMSDKDILEGDRIEFNIDTETGIAYEGKMFLSQNHFFIEGPKIEKTGEATYYAESAVATSCDGGSPDWRLKGRELDVTVDGYGTMKDTQLLAKNLPIFYTPYLFFPAKTARQSGFLFPYLAYSKKKLGWDMELPYFWAISESTDATFYQRYMDKRGFKEGVEYRYFTSRNSFGTFYGDFMNDTWRTSGEGDTTGGLRRDWQSDNKRWSYYWNHETTFSPSSYLRTDLRKVSDNWYFRDFSSHNYYLSNYALTEARRFRKVPFVGDETLSSLDSSARFVKNWQLYNLTALVRYTDDFRSYSNDATLQKYPEITLKGIKRPIAGTPLNFELDAAYDYYYRTEGQKGHLYDMQPVLSRPLRLGDYLQLTPQIGLKSTVWDRDDNSVVANSATGKHGDRELYLAGATATTEIHRIFDVDGEEIDKIRHGIRPELIYTYIPNIYQDDAPDFVIRIPEQNTLAYALTNTLTARLRDEGGGKSYLEFLRFKLAQTYDLKEARRGDAVPLREKRPFSDIDMELDVKPSRYFSFAARNRFSVNSGDWKQANYDLNLRDLRGDSATVGYRYAQTVVEEINPSGSSIPFYPYRYSQASLEEINLTLKAVITKAISLTYFVREDETIHKTLETTYGLNYSKQCWSIDVQYSVTVDDKMYIVLLNLYGLGKGESQIRAPKK